MSTLYKSTVSAVLQIVSDLRGESSTNTDASRIRSVSRAEQDLAKRKPWKLFLLPDQTQTANGTDTSFTIGSATYPMREKGLSEVFVGGTTEDKRYEIVDFFRYKVLYNQNNSARICYEWYDVANDLFKVRINPTPANGDVITYSYFWVPPTRTATSDAVISPNLDILARLALAYTYEGEDEDKYQDELMIAEKLIDEEFGKSNSPAVNQLQKFDSITNAIRPRGIGSY